jgi:hypothetical protein
VGFITQKSQNDTEFKLSVETFDRAFALACATCHDRINTGSPRLDDDRGWWRQLVDRTLDTMEVHSFDRAAYFNDLYTEFTRPGVWELIRKFALYLETLWPQFFAGIISNFDSRFEPFSKQFDPGALRADRSSRVRSGSINRTARFSSRPPAPRSKARPKSVMSAMIRSRLGRSGKSRDARFSARSSRQ